MKTSQGMKNKVALSKKTKTDSHGIIHKLHKTHTYSIFCENVIKGKAWNYELDDIYC